MERQYLKVFGCVVEAGGVEPPSENIPLRRLHIYPDFKFSPQGLQPGGSAEGLTRIYFRITDLQVKRIS